MSHSTVQQQAEGAHSVAAFRVPVMRNPSPRFRGGGAPASEGEGACARGTPPVIHTKLDGLGGRPRRSPEGGAYEALHRPHLGLR